MHRDGGEGSPEDRGGGAGGARVAASGSRVSIITPAVISMTPVLLKEDHASYSAIQHVISESDPAFNEVKQEADILEGELAVKQEPQIDGQNFS